MRPLDFSAGLYRMFENGKIRRIILVYQAKEKMNIKDTYERHLVYERKKIQWFVKRVHGILQQKEKPT